MPSVVETAIAILKRRVRVAAAVGMLTLGAVGTAPFALPDMYRASTTVLVERQQPAEAFGTPASDGGDLETRVHTLSQQAVSRSRLEDIIKQYDLYPALRPHVPAALLAEHMRGDISLDLTESEQPLQSATVAVRVSYQGFDRDKIPIVTHTIATFYVEENSRVRGEAATATAAFLKDQLRQTKERLDQQAAQLTEYKRKYTEELPQQVVGNLAALQRLNAQLQLNNENQRRAVERREELADQLAAETIAPSPEARNPAAARVAELQKRLVDLQRRLGELRSRLTPRHPDVIRLESEIATVETKLAAARPHEIATPPAAGGDSGVTPQNGHTTDSNGAPSAAAVVARLQHALNQVDRELATLNHEEQQLRQAISTYEMRVQNAPKREGEFAELSSGYDAAIRLYDSLLKRYEDAQMAERIEQRRTGEQFRLLDSETPLAHPVAPNRFNLLMLSIVLSLGLAGFAGLVAEKLDASFHSLDELRAFTSVPIVAAVPRLARSGDARRRWCRFCLETMGLACVLAVVVAGSWAYFEGNEGVVRSLAARQSVGARK